MNAGRCVQAIVSRPAQPMATPLTPPEKPGVEVGLDDADGDHEVRLRHAARDRWTGAPSEVSPRSAVSVSMPCASNTSTRRTTCGPASRARSASPVVACRPQPIATATASSGTPAAASSSSSASRTGSLGQGREASGMVTTTERAPRASSRRRGAPTGAASAARDGEVEVGQRRRGRRRLEARRRGARAAAARRTTPRPARSRAAGAAPAASRRGAAPRPPHDDDADEREQRPEKAA